MLQKSIYDQYTEISAVSFQNKQIFKYLTYSVKIKHTTLNRTLNICKLVIISDLEVWFFYSMFLKACDT